MQSENMRQPGRLRPSSALASAPIPVPTPTPTSTNRNRRNYKVSRYSDSFHWPGRSDVKPRIVSSSHLSGSKREASALIDDFCPYSRLNYADMHLSSSEALKEQRRRLFSQRVSLGLLALLIALAGTGLLWMQYSNAAALESDLLQSEVYERPS